MDMLLETHTDLPQPRTSAVTVQQMANHNGDGDFIMFLSVEYWPGSCACKSRKTLIWTNLAMHVYHLRKYTCGKNAQGHRSRLKTNEIEGQADRGTNGDIDGKKGSETDRQTDGRVDRQTERQTGR